MNTPTWSMPATHARHDPDAASSSPLDRALHVKRYQWVRDTMCTKDSSVLDMGCGTGFGVEILASVAREALGVDFSDAGLAVARSEHTAANTTFLHADLTSIDLIDGFHGRRFDVITSMETIEHLEDYFSLVANAARLLQPHGVFIVGTPNRRMTYERLPDRRHMDASHVQEFTRLSLEHTLREWFAEVTIHFEWIPRYWAVRSAAVGPTSSRRAALARSFLPPRAVTAIRNARTRFGHARATVPQPWSVDDVEIVAATEASDLASEAFCLIAVCRRPHPSPEQSSMASAE